MFTEEDRDRLRNSLIQRAREDARITAAAAVGSSAVGGDRWSDLDLSFAVSPAESVDLVLTEWTDHLVRTFDAAVLFDLPFLSSIYRVFVLPGALQVDLSFTPSADFGALGPRFHLLFGEATELKRPHPPLYQDMLGLAVHHVVRVRLCLERGRVWQAEYWLHAACDQILSLACARLRLDPANGRGFDALPNEVLEPMRQSVANTVTLEGMRLTLSAVVGVLLTEIEHLEDPHGRIRKVLSIVVDS